MFLRCYLPNIPALDRRQFAAAWHGGAGCPLVLGGKRAGPRGLVKIYPPVFYLDIPVTIRLLNQLIRCLNRWLGLVFYRDLDLSRLWI